MEKLNRYGYRRIYVKKRGRMLEHRYIMEKIIGRPLKKEEKVHHKNGIRHDNRPENLELIDNHSEHIHIHHSQIWKTRKENNASIDWNLYEIPPKNYLHDKRTKCLVKDCQLIEHARNLCFKHMVAYKRFLKRKSFFK